MTTAPRRRRATPDDDTRTATCREAGCPQQGVPTPIPDDATRVVCGGCQHVVPLD